MRTSELGAEEQRWPGPAELAACKALASPAKTPRCRRPVHAVLTSRLKASITATEPLHNLGEDGSPALRFQLLPLFTVPQPPASYARGGTI